MRAVLLFVAGLAQALLLTFGAAALIGIAQAFSLYRRFGVVAIGDAEIIAGAAVGLVVRVAFLFIKGFSRGDA